jgi:hypothetical protein
MEIKRSRLKLKMQMIIFFFFFFRYLNSTFSRSEFLPEDQDLKLIVAGQHTSASNTSEDVRSSSFEERADSLFGKNLLGAVN